MARPAASRPQRGRRVGRHRQVWRLCAGALLFATPRLAEGEIRLTTIESVPAEAGQFATFSCRIWDARGDPLDPSDLSEVRIRFQPPVGWTALTVERTLVLAPGAEMTVPFTARVPAQADPGRSHDGMFQLYFPADRETPQVATRGMRVLPRYDLRLQAADTELSVRAGESIELSVLVHNGGNCTDRVRLLADSVPNWGAAVEPGEIRVEPGETVTSRVSMRVPESARQGTLHLLDVRAESEGASDRDEAVVAFARVRTVVLPAPEPESRYGRLPVATTFSAGSVSPGEESYAVHVVASGGVGTESDFSMEANLATGSSQSGAGGWQNQTLRARLRRDSWELTAGDLGVTLQSQLAASFSGRGARLTMARGPWSLHLLDVKDRQGQGTGSWSAGIGRELSPSLRLGGDILVRETAHGRSGIRVDRVEAVHATWGGPAGSTLRGEVAASRSRFDSREIDGRGAELRLERTGRTAQIRGRAHTGSEGFGGRTGDRDGALLFAAWAPGAHFVRFWTNLETQDGGTWATDSTRTELSRGRIGVRLEPRHRPGLEVSAGETEEHTHRADSTTFAFRRRDITVTTQLSRGSYVAVATWNHGRVRDLRSGDEGTVRSREMSAGGRLGDLRAALRWSSSVEWSPLFGSAVTSSGWTADLARAVCPPIAQLGLSVGERVPDARAAVGISQRQLFVEPRMDLRIRGKWTLRLDASMERINGESRIAHWRIALHHAPSDLLPIPWLPLRGGVQGVAFVDLDGDGLPGGTEPRVPGLVVRTDGRSQTTDRQGGFSWPTLEPGTYWIEIDRGSIPREYRGPDDLPIEVRVAAGHDEQVWIPLRPCGGVSGVAFFDENRNGTREDGELGLADLRLGLWQEGVSVASTITDEEGRFEMGRVPAGSYELRADPEWRPSGWLPTSEASGYWFEVDQAEDRVLPPYGLAPRQKPIVVTYPGP